MHLLDHPELWRDTSTKIGKGDKVKTVTHKTVRLTVENPVLPIRPPQELPYQQWLQWRGQREEQRAAYRGQQQPKRNGRYSDKHGTLVSRLQLFGLNPDGCLCADCGRALSWDAGKGPDQIIVRYLDGDTLNVSTANLVAVCPSCNRTAVNPQHTKEYLEKRETERKERFTADVIAAHAELEARLNPVPVPMPELSPEERQWLESIEADITKSKEQDRLKKLAAMEQPYHFSGL